jgi:hypothetical protein
MLQELKDKNWRESEMSQEVKDKNERDTEIF